jgi:hypothetical protein
MQLRQSVAFGCAVVTLWMGFGVGAATADDVAGVNDLLCSSRTATQCLADGGCTAGPLWKWNVPSFVEIDLEALRLESTAASSNPRSTPIASVERSDHHLVLQGHEQGRAFTMTIALDTGHASTAIVLEGQVVVVFGECTPRVPAR